LKNRNAELFFVVDLQYADSAKANTHRKAKFIPIHREALCDSTTAAVADRLQITPQGNMRMDNSFLLTRNFCLVLMLGLITKICRVRNRGRYKLPEFHVEVKNFARKGYIDFADTQHC